LRKKTTVWARILPLARALVASGHQVTLLIPPWDSPADAGSHTNDSGVHLEQVALTGGPLATVARMVRRIDALAPDIVHIVKPRAHAGLVHLWLHVRRRFVRRARSPHLLLDIDDWEQAWTPINRYPWPLAQFLAWQENWGIAHADAITAASRWLESHAQRVNPGPVLYLPNGVTPLPSPPPRAPASPPQILFFSRFVEVAPQWPADFWRALHRLLPTAEFVIAGAPVQPHLAAAWHTALADLPQVRWAGYVQPKEMAHLYAQAACAIFPAMPIPLHQAKCSVRLATTLLHGVPVIASAVGEQVPYATAGGAILLPADATPAHFAEAVAAAILAPAPPATQPATLLTAYAWPTLTRRLAEFYASLPTT
jgi:glycosyltransferase involved in cell wall biosynthesis